MLNLVTLVIRLLLMRVRFKSTMKESVLVVRDVEAQEEEPEVELEGVAAEDVVRGEGIEVVEVVPLMELSQRGKLRREPKIEMKEDLTVEENQDLTVEENQDLTVEENQNLTVGENQDLTVEENQDLTVEENQDLTVEENQDLIVEEMMIKMPNVKKTTALKDQEVKETITAIKLMVIDHQVDIKVTTDKKEVLDVELEVAKDHTTTIKIDQEEEELKVITTMRVELEEETEILDHKLLLTDQPEADQEVELQEAMILVVEEP